MGINMPARTVLFTNARKFDGKDFRWVSKILNILKYLSSVVGPKVISVHVVLEIFSCKYSRTCT